MAGAAQFNEPTVTFEVSSYTVEGPNPLGPERTEEILAPFTGEHAGVEGLNEAALSLERELRARGYSFYRVVLPPQTLTGGAVRLTVVEFLVSGVQVRGNEHFDEDNIQASLPALVVGEVAAGETGVATSMNAIARTVGSSTAAALVAVLLSRTTLAGTPMESSFVAIFVGGAVTAGLAMVLIALSRQRTPTVASPEARYESRAMNHEWG